MNTLSAPFIFDDLQAICDNEHIRRLWPIWDAMFYTTPDSPITGRPIASLSVAVNHALGGFDVRGYHVFNIAVHLAAALAFWGVLRRTFSSTRLAARFGSSAPFLAMVSALIWALHPLQTEAVTYIVQRTELLLGLFYFLTLYCAIRAWQSDRSRFWTLAAVVSCALGMGSKEAMISAPLMVVLYDLTLVSRSPREALRSHTRLYIGLGATWILLAWLMITYPHVETIGVGLGLHWLDYLRTQAAVIVWYLRLCFWPHPLVISYQGWPIATSFGPILPQGIFIVALLGLTGWALYRRHPLGLLGAWFFMILAPSSSVVPIVTEIAAERRMYLPLAAVVILVVAAGFELIRRLRGRQALPQRVLMVAASSVPILASVALGCTTFLRNRDYQTAIGIWTDTVAKAPLNYLAWNNLAYVMNDQAQHEKLIEYYTRSIELNPGFAEAHNNRGAAYGRKGMFGDAIRDCSRAIELRPGYMEAYYNRGRAYNEIGDYESAIRDFTKVIECKPGFAEAYNYRGLAHGRKGMLNDAVRDCTAAIELKPDFAEAYSNRGLAFSGKGEHDLAVRDFSTAIRLKPDFAEAYNNRGRAFGAKREHDQAIRDYTMAVGLNPDFAEAYNNRAVSYFNLEQYDLAWADVKRCRELGFSLNPGFVAALSAASGRAE